MTKKGIFSCRLGGCLSHFRQRFDELCPGSVQVPKPVNEQVPKICSFGPGKSPEKSCTPHGNISSGSCESEVWLCKRGANAHERLLTFGHIYRGQSMMSRHARRMWTNYANKVPQYMALLPCFIKANCATRAATIRRHRTQCPGQFGPVAFSNDNQLARNSFRNALSYEILRWYANCVI